MEGTMPDLSSLGVPDGMTDPNQIIAFLAGKLAMPAAERSMDEEPIEAPEPVESMEEEVPVKPEEEILKMDEAVKEEVARALAAERKRRAEIVSDCTLAKLERSFADKLCDSGISADEARKLILKEQANQTITRSASDWPLGVVDGTDPRYSVGGNVSVTESGEDKFANAVRDGLVQRAYRTAGLRRTIERAAPGANEFVGMGLNRIAEFWLERQGLPVRRMSRNEIAKAAMGNRGVLERYRIERDAFHTRGSFPALMLDAANKTLLAAYDEAPYTWSLWPRNAGSTEDFKNINRIRFGESPDLEAIPETQPYPEKSITDNRVSYAVQKYGALFSVSWETVVNDDLDAISRVPAMHGNAARRLQNKKVYEVLTSNPTMNDGQALFSASHASGDNTSGAAAAPGVTTLNTGYTKMMLQKGLSSSSVLGITPRYLIVPANYAATALEIVNSQSYAQSNGNEGVVNIYGVNGVRPLSVVAEPILDAASSTVWYLAADTSQIDTVELTFLSGEESPVLESEMDFDTDTYKYKVRQTFGVAPIDWRGLYRNSA